MLVECREIHFQPFLMKPTIIFLMVHLSCIQPHMLVSICNHFLYWGQSFHMHTLLLGFSQTAFPCLAAALLGPTTMISDSVMQECFISSLSAHEAAMLQNAASCVDNRYVPDIESELTSIFANHGVRGIVKPQNLRRLLLQASKYTFLIKPAAALHMIASGIPKSHIPFWKSMTADNLYLLYKTMLLSPSKVLSLLIEPYTKDETEEKTWFYLRSYIGNMSNDELRRFIRFVTGSFVISVKAITVSFNRLDGFARRPIAHTCSARLELPSTYSSLPEFISEFRSILSDPHYSWEMDAL